jgi:uncharacterized membrane protein
MTVWSLRLFVKLWSIKKVPRWYQISNSKWDSERTRRDLQFRRYNIFFGSFNQEQWLFEVKDSLSNFEALKSTKTVSYFKFKIRFWKSSTRSTILTLPHHFWIFQSRAMPVWSLRLFVTLWSIKKIPRRYQISNSKCDSEKA